MEIQPPRTLAFVVESDVLGKTAISVPCHEVKVHGLDSEEEILLSANRVEIEDEIDRRETEYLDAHEAKVNPWQLDRDELRRQVQKRIDRGDTYGTIAAEIGWTRADNKNKSGFRPDGARVKRCIGMRTDAHHPNAALQLEDAEALCRVLGLDPVDVGL